jgi:glycosyltransferase involved in cell wall biosynthesis
MSSTVSRETSARNATVSVIIPVYNTAQFVAEALDSVLAQTYTDYEIIVVNDASPDTEMLEKVLVPYCGRITYIVQENGGLCAARNAALKASRAPYVAMLDSDDRWHPEYLASQLALLNADPGIDVLYPDAKRFTAAGVDAKPLSDSYALRSEISFLRVLARECQIYGGVTARRSTLLEVGLYDEDLRSAEDLDLWLRILKAGGRIAYNDRVLAYYRFREGSLTSNEPELAKDLLKFLDKLETKMELTNEEKLAVDRQRKAVLARLNLAEGKLAFYQGDTRAAVAKLTLAAEQSGSWKLRAVIAALKIAPGIMLRWYRLRKKLDSGQRLREQGI